MSEKTLMITIGESGYSLVHELSAAEKHSYICGDGLYRIAGLQYTGTLVRCDTCGTFWRRGTMNWRKPLLQGRLRRRYPCA